MSEGLPIDPVAQAAEWSRELQDAGPQEILQWAIRQFGEGLAIGSRFGKDGLVILDLARKIRSDIPVLFLETGYHFEETLAFRDRLKQEWGLNVVDLTPELTVAEQDARFGVNLFAKDPDRCCAMRKVEPLQRALARRKAWITGVRRDQHAQRGDVPAVQWQELPNGSPGVFKVNPMINMTREDVEDYLVGQNLPRHPLWDQGFPSIGCWPCTRAVAPGGGERDGRWAGTGKTECGIHVVGVR
jgi:phosphoadenosine phosphosulfate reductase